MVKGSIFEEERAKMGYNLESNYSGGLIVVFDKFVESISKLLFGGRGEEELRVLVEDAGDAVFEGESLATGDELKHSHDERID